MFSIPFIYKLLLVKKKINNKNLSLQETFNNIVLLYMLVNFKLLQFRYIQSSHDTRKVNLKDINNVYTGK